MKRLEAENGIEPMNKACAGSYSFVVQITLKVNNRIDHKIDGHWAPQPLKSKITDFSGKTVGFSIEFNQDLEGVRER